MQLFIIQGDDFGALRVAERKEGGKVERRREEKGSLEKWQGAEYRVTGYWVM